MYSIVEKVEKAHANADASSRLPLPHTPSRTLEPGDNVFVMQVAESTPVDSERRKTKTRGDPVLSRVCKIVQLGWPKRCPDEALRPYHNRENELSLHDGCLMWGTKVVVSLSLKN